MVKLRNITMHEDGTVSMDCHVIDRIKRPDFFLHFNPKTREIYSDMTDIDYYYAGHAVLHIYFLVRDGIKLPKESTAAWV